MDKYRPNLKEDGILICDSDLVEPPTGRFRVFGLPATDIAHKTFGRDVVANVIMVGGLAGLTRVVSADSLRQAISESVPPKTVDINLRAFDEGFRRGTREESRLREVKR